MSVIEFGNPINKNNNSSHSVTTKVSEIAGKNGPVTNENLKLYRSDNRGDRTKFEKQMPNLNPAWVSMGDTGGGYDEKGHAYQYLNPYRTVEIMIGSTNYKNIHEKNWGNWRSFNGAQIVPDNVLLILEDAKIGFKFSHQIEAAWEGLQDKGFLKQVSSALEVARLASSMAGGAGQGSRTGGKFMSMYKKVPAWKDTDPLSLETNLTFKFKFGQFGLFSGEWEVVRPIITLASHFGVSSAGGNYMKGPAPTPPTYLMHLFGQAGSLAASAQSAFSGLAAAGKAAMSSPNPFATMADGVVGSLTALEEAIYAAMDKAISEGFNDVRTIAIRIGRLTVGNIIVKSIGWSFDYNNVDEYGYPIAGEISLSDLEMVFYPTAGSITGAFA